MLTLFVVVDVGQVINGFATVGNIYALQQCCFIVAVSFNGIIRFCYLCGMVHGIVRKFLFKGFLFKYRPYIPVYRVFVTLAQLLQQR